MLSNHPKTTRTRSRNRTRSWCPRLLSISEARSGFKLLVRTDLRNEALDHPGKDEFHSVPDFFHSLKTEFADAEELRMCSGAGYVSTQFKVSERDRKVSPLTSEFASSLSLLSLPARDEWGESRREGRREKPTSSPRPSPPFGEEREKKTPILIRFKVPMHN